MDVEDEAEVLTSSNRDTDSSSPITILLNQRGGSSPVGGGSGSGSGNGSGSGAGAAAASDTKNGSPTHIHIHLDSGAIAAASAAHGPVEPKVMSAYDREQSRLEAIFQLERQRLERYHSVQLARIQDRFRLLAAAASAASSGDAPLLPLAISMSSALTDDAWTEQYPKKNSQFGFFEGCKVLMSMFRGQNEQSIAAALTAISTGSAGTGSGSGSGSGSAASSGGAGGGSGGGGSSLSQLLGSLPSTGSDLIDSAESVDLALRRSHAQYKELKREMDLRHKVQRETLASMHTHGIV